MVNEINNFGYCGKDCSNCPNFINSTCSGCKFIFLNKTINTLLPECENCKIRFCAEKNGVSFCFLCPKFPCQYFSFLSQEELSKIYDNKKLLCESDESLKKVYF
jgi:hypothetical protein